MSKKKQSAEQPAELKLNQGYVTVTLEQDDFDISPQLSPKYSVGQSVVAEGATLDALFVGGHPIKGRNG